MIELTTLSIGEPSRETFALFKQDASIPDEHRDAVLRMHLKSAMAAIQAVTNKTLLPSRLQVTVSDREDNDAVMLYQSVKAIVSVTDGQGEPLSYSRDGRCIKPDNYTPTVIVTYDTDVDGCGLGALQSVVSRYAVALYDHESVATLNAIKASAL